MKKTQILKIKVLQQFYKNVKPSRFSSYKREPILTLNMVQYEYTCGHELLCKQNENLNPLSNKRHIN